MTSSIGSAFPNIPGGIPGGIRGGIPGGNVIPGGNPEHLYRLVQNYRINVPGGGPRGINGGGADPGDL